MFQREYGSFYAFFLGRPRFDALLVFRFAPDFLLVPDFALTFSAVAVVAIFIFVSGANACWLSCAHQMNVSVPAR